MPRASYFLPTMKPVMFCRKTSGILLLAAQLDEMRALERAFGKQHAVVGDYADRHAVDMGKAGGPAWCRNWP